MLEKTYEFINDDTQYKKYKLLKINKYRKLIKIRFFCLKDVRMKTNNYIMLDNHLSEKICEKLKQLKDKKYIKENINKVTFQEEIINLQKEKLEQQIKKEKEK